MVVVLFFVVSFLASTVGAICGIGGGVIIKPVLDLCGLASVSTISFLSNCTVLAMTCYSVGKNVLSGDNKVSFKVGTPLAVGAAVGGVLGKQIFSTVKAMFENQNTVGAVQAACLAVVTVGTFVYTLYKQKIPTRNVQGAAPCVIIGLLLGIMSSFLGIGGGPINLVVLFYFFSMQTKVAAQYSLYIILFSQITSIATTFVTRSVPDFELLALVLMVAGGIGGGIAGRSLNKKLDNKAVDKLFLLLMAVIIGISVFNTVKYATL